MTAEIIRDAKVVIGGYDLENRAKTCVIEFTYPTQDATGFGDTARVFVLDIPQWTARIDFTDDFDAGELNEQLWAWKGTQQTFTARKADQAISTSNPEFVGNVLILNVVVFNAGVGQLAGGTLQLQGSGALDRDTSP